MKMGGRRRIRRRSINRRTDTTQRRGAVDVAVGKRRIGKRMTLSRPMMPVVSGELVAARSLRAEVGAEEDFLADVAELDVGTAGAGSTGAGVAPAGAFTCADETATESETTLVLLELFAWPHAGNRASSVTVTAERSLIDHHPTSAHASSAARAVAHRAVVPTSAVHPARLRQ